MTLKEYLETKKLPFRTFSLKVGIDHAQLHRYANGKHIPSLPNIDKIFKATNGSVAFEDWLDTYKEERG